MRRRSLPFLLLFVGSMPSGILAAPAHLIPSDFPEARFSGGAQQIELGHSTLALMGPWKFRLGNDPHWAQPGYDDSGWQDYTILKQGWPTQVFSFGEAGDPGWAAHGYRAQWGYGWYRIRVDLRPTGSPLSLLMPQVDGAYAVYWDGTKVGGLGDPERRESDTARTNAFPLPAALTTSGEHVLAIQVWDRALRALEDSPAGGGLLGVPLVAESGIGTRIQLLMQRNVALFFATAAFGEILPYSLIGLFSLVLFFYNRRKREYLWIGFAMLTYPLGDLVIGAGTNAGSGQISSFVYSVADAAEYVFLLFSLLASLWLLGLERRRWMHFAILVSWAIYFFALITALIDQWFLFSPQLFRETNDASLAGMVLMFAILVWITIAGIRAQGAKAWLMLSPWLLTALSGAFAVLSPGHLQGTELLFTAEGLALLVPLSVLAILAFRFLRQWRQHQALLRDRAEAQAVQQLVISGELPKTPGLAIEVEYRPAQEVGGDFFQVLPSDADGSVLIVIGDVTGKGLQAAMLVALMVGCIRTAAETRADPRSLLHALNRQLCSHSHAQATCLALWIKRDGSVRLANAGHLPPYNNGAELDVPGSLPLGILAAAEYEEASFRLMPGDRWMLLSDGVVEAANSKKELFGFDRARAVSEESASAIAQAAQTFGQQDDITVLTVMYQPVAAEVVYG